MLICCDCRLICEVAGSEPLGRQDEIKRARARDDREDLESDWWIWNVIFTMFAIAMLGLATLFSLGAG
jgi:hypothetical protein